MASLKGLFARFRPKGYARRPPLILINGLAEQHESWFRNKRYWSRYFDVYAPNILVYDGQLLRDRFAARHAVTVDYIVGQLHTFVTQFVQNPPYHLVASSLGGKVAVEFAVRYPELTNRVVLLCPSGMGDKENLPIMEGLKGGGRNMGNVVKSVFHNARTIDRGLQRFYERVIHDREWKKGIVKTTNGTLEHTVRAKMRLVQAPTLLITGEMDRICDPATAEAAAAELPHGHFVKIPGCGHAPQIERHWLTNRLVAHFLSARVPSVHSRLTHLMLGKPTRAAK